MKSDSDHHVQPDGPLPDPPVLWSIGQPTDEEQLYLEYINRSRANPPAEGARLAATTDAAVLSAYDFFNVDLALMQSQFNAIAPVPPLAMSVELMRAARLHSGDMFTNQFQGHDSSNGANLGDRARAQNYSYTSLRENVYSYAESVWHGHAGFNVDWGFGPGGMQTPPGHRVNIHATDVREVGIGVVNGVNGDVGPQLVTQDFGSRQGATPFITGVAYYDFNGNQFYDLGEGIGGVRVDVPGSAYYAITAGSGGYALPVTTNGTYAMTFSAPGLNAQMSAPITSSRNVRINFVPTYYPPVITGPNPASLNEPNAYTITAVGGATGYDWTSAILATYDEIEGAESLANVTVSISPGYSVQASSPRYAGTYSFHLAHPETVDQIVHLNTTLRPQSTSMLNFYKRLGWAGAGQVARAQVSTNSGVSWQDLWSQAGSGGSGESVFSQVTASLAPYAGTQLRLRFVYDFTGGSYYYQTDEGVGFYLDNIAVSDAWFLSDPITNSIAGTSFTFTPTQRANYLLAARAQLPGRVLDWGPAIAVSAIASGPPPTVQVASGLSVNAGQVQLDFSVSNYRSGMAFQLYRAPSPSGTWEVDPAATLQTIVPSSQYRFTTQTGSATSSYYRVLATY